MLSFACNIALAGVGCHAAGPPSPGRMGSSPHGWASPAGVGTAPKAAVGAFQFVVGLKVANAGEMEIHRLWLVKEQLTSNRN